MSLKNNIFDNFDDLEPKIITNQELEEKGYVKDGNKFGDLEIWKNQKEAKVKLLENLSNGKKLVKFKISLN